jgi:hypothetical protein
MMTTLAATSRADTSLTGFGKLNSWRTTDPPRFHGACGMKPESFLAR